MAGVMSMRVEAKEIIAAVRRMKPREREAFLEDLLAATSPKYLESIREARLDHKSGRIRSHAEVFNEWYSTWRGRKSSSSEWDTGGRSIDGNLPSEAT